MKVYGLTGYPLTHSFSKKYFLEKFKRENISGCSFELFPLENISSFPGLVSGVANLHGLAVTIPHKQSVIPYLTSLGSVAKKTGAVNCIRISGKTLKGYNTDIIGFEKSFVRLLKNYHKKALILGSGGSSKAVQYVLTQLGMPFLILSREMTGSGIISYEMIDEKLIKEYPVIINCTPVGMSLSEELPAIPYQYLNEKNFLYDLVYTSPVTNFLQKGLEKNAIIKNGYEMLVLQAEENWKIWNE